MVLIEGHWENINNLQKAVRIIREYYNPDLANEMEKIIEAYDYDEKYVENLEDTIEEIRRLVN